jgi:putative long chain acyl-CoA synthase
MPKGLWRRVVKRFAPATVVEFFASTEGNAVLVNLTGEKVGSLGRPLPGGGEVGIAAWNLEEGQLVERESGFAGECKSGEIGLLVERVERERGDLGERPLRSVFEAGDAWRSTRDLVRIDEEGDYWLIDHTDDVIHGPSGAIATIPVEDVLTSENQGVDLAAVYGVGLPESGVEIPVAALTLQPGVKLDLIALRHTVEHRLPRQHRPIVIRLVDQLPMTAGHRTRKRALRREGLGLEDGAGETLWLAPGEKGYVPLSTKDLGLLLEKRS